MKFLILILCSILPCALFATGQIGDQFIYKGDTTSIFSNPLESREDINTLRTKLFNRPKGSIYTNTACWRGYIAEWTLTNDTLYLTNIYSCNYGSDRLKANLKKVFGDECKNGKVYASWVNRNIYQPKGDCIHYIHAEYESYYEYEIFWKFEKGILQDTTVYDNSRSYVSDFTKTSNDKLNNFLYSNINWSLIPDLKKEEIKVYGTISSGDSLKPKFIEIAKPASIDILNKETERVLKLIPEWNIYYKHGMPVSIEWNIPIVFSEKNRRKFNQK